MLYRTVWMSDLHLGTRGSNAAGVLDFFKHNEFERQPQGFSWSLYYAVSEGCRMASNFMTPTSDEPK